MCFPPLPNARSCLLSLICRTPSRLGSLPSRGRFSRLQAIGGIGYRDHQRHTSEKLLRVEASGLTEMKGRSVRRDEAGTWPAGVADECSEAVDQARIDRHSDHAIGIRTLEPVADALAAARLVRAD